MTSQGLKLLYLGAGLLLVIMGLGNAFIQQQSLRDYYSLYEKRYYGDNTQSRNQGVLQRKSPNEIGPIDGDDNGDNDDELIVMKETDLLGLCMGTVIDGRVLDLHMGEDRVLIHSKRELEKWISTLRQQVGGESPLREYRVLIQLGAHEGSGASAGNEESGGAGASASGAGSPESEDGIVTDVNRLEVRIIEWRDTYGE